MDNNNLRFEHSPYHNLFIKDRKTVELTGVKHIESFDSEEFLIETSLGYLNITGKDLVLIKLDNNEQEVSIRGNIDGVAYISSKKSSSPKETLFGKLLK